MSVFLRGVRNSFGSSVFDVSFASSSLVDIQRRSFFGFLYSNDRSSASIDEVFNSVFPVHDSFGYAMVEFVSYRLTEPKFTIEECRRKSATYAADLYITIRLVLFDIDQATGVTEIRNIKEQELLLCSMPMMTKNVTFVINGFERVVVSQIHRSPGVFFAREMIDGNMIYSASIIPYRGSWLEFVFDQRGNLAFRMDKKRKMSIYYLLTAMKMQVKDILDYFYTPLLIKYNEQYNLWSVNFDLENIIGCHAIFDVLNIDGEIILEKGAIINKKSVEQLKKLGDYYCTSQDLCGKVLICDVAIDEEILWNIATVLTDSIIETMLSNKVYEISIIDSSIRSYASPVINAIIAHKSIDYSVAMEAMFKILCPGEPFTLVESEKQFENAFFNPSYYNLFAVGRYKLNVSLGLDVAENVTILCHEDILITIKKLINLKENALDADDIDSLCNRRVRSVGELLENQFRIGLSRVVRSITEKLNTVALDTAVPEDLIITAPVAKAVKDFFMTSQLSQFMDQNNPLAELAHKRRISSLGAGGLSRDRAGIEVRDVHPTHYGRICPIETPEGQNIGLISSLATYSMINKYGFIETPYRKIVNRKLTNDVVFFDATKEVEYVISQADASVVKDGVIVKDFVSARRAGESTMAMADDIQMMDISPKQTISVVASLIPFLENDDAKRALMGSNMQRQAVPLIVADAPLIGTGMEREVTVDSGVLVTANRPGVVIMADAQCIIIRVSGDEGSLTNDIDVYYLRKFKRSNQNTCINQVTLVKSGNVVEAGQVIADGPATKYGEIALGKNLLVAFMPWCGYNFEDSIVISEKIVHDDVFTSIHIEEFEVVVRDTRLGAEEITRDIPNTTDESLQYLDEIGIVHLGTSVSTNDVLVGKITPKSEPPITPEEKLLKAIFGEKCADVKDSSLRIPPGVSGIVIDVQILTRRGNEKDPRAKHIEQQDLLILKNSHERKMDCINSFILSELDPILNGCEVSYVVKNKKKVKESLNKDNLCNFDITQKLSFQFDDADIEARVLLLRNQYNKLRSQAEDEYVQCVESIMCGDDLQAGVLKIVKVFVAVKSKLQPGDKMAGRHGNKGIVAKIVPVEDMPFMEDGTPVDIVLNPLGVPGRINIGQIMETHLGFVSYLMGKQISSYLSNSCELSKMREFLMNTLTDSRLKSKLTAMSEEEFLSVAKFYSKGVPFATPVFEGAKVLDIESLLKKCGGNESGQMILYDGQTGMKFDRTITVGYIYMMKLHHLASNKIHARSTGPYSLVTQQPLGGKSHFGGQRFGEMECWALQAYGAAYSLQEMLTVKSDDVDGRVNMYESIVKGEMKFDCGVPESFNVLFRELRALCFNVKLEGN